MTTRNLANQGIRLAGGWMAVPWALFPLTLTLSPRERGTVIQSGRWSQRARIIPGPEKRLPLPEGEGWGEGEGGTGCLDPPPAQETRRL